jgi:hypothetical protein
VVQPEAADKIWLTCCALHNWLLEADAIDDWDGELGLNDIEDLRLAPFALQRLQQTEFSSFGSREHETEAVLEKQRARRRGLDEESDGETEVAVEIGEVDLPRPTRYDATGAVVVNSLTYDDFRNRLVEHFDILYRRNRVKWPVRSKDRRSIESAN